MRRTESDEDVHGDLDGGGVEVARVKRNGSRAFVLEITEQNLRFYMCGTERGRRDVPQDLPNWIASEITIRAHSRAKSRVAVLPILYVQVQTSACDKFYPCVCNPELCWRLRSLCRDLTK